MRLFKKLTRNTENQQEDLMDIFNKVDLEDATYVLYQVRLCKLSRISDKNKKKLSCVDLEKYVVKEDVLMVNIAGDFYMDIQTGKYYELRIFSDKNLKHYNNELYVSDDESFYHKCYDVIKSKNLQPNDMLGLNELKAVYKEYYETKTKQFGDEKSIICR
ncbi:MAG: hypothetical protein ACLRFE_00960 [Clostridia bacterium]